ncbi:MAG: NAD(P)-dependent oxidoreductase [Pseudomonadota bacterium]
MTTRLGFIGLGRMGRGMARNLGAKHPGLLIFDSVQAAMTPVVESGAKAATSVAEMAAKTDLIFLCVPYAPEVRAVLFGADGIAATGHKPVIVDTTTLDRQDALEIATDAAQLGLDYYDCPISGMPLRAENGTLTTMFGGPAEAFVQVKPFLKAFGEDTIHAGPLGSGQAMKAINNIIYDVNIAALAEVLPFAVKVGLDPDALAHLVTTASSRSFASEYFVPKMKARRFDTDFTLENAYKDIVNVQRMAIETRASLPIVNAMVATYQAAMAAGFADEPKSAMLKVYEDRIAVRFEGSKDD